MVSFNNLTYININKTSSFDCELMCLELQVEQSQLKAEMQEINSAKLD